MTARHGTSGLLVAAALFSALSCAGRSQPATYDIPPVLANREEIREAMTAVGAGFEAQVVLRVRVDEQGRVSHVRISKSSGDNNLDAAAEWIGEQMRFEPARRDGAAVAALVDVPVTFDVVRRVVHPPRMRNGDEVVAKMIREYPDLEGTARFRVHVGPEGWPREVKDRPSDQEVARAAHDLMNDLVFWPAYRRDNVVEAWVNVVFEFAGVRSRVYIED
jgi:TonB family protein